jgi:cell division protein FtsI (penicillin-binding protein 3)
MRQWVDCKVFGLSERAHQPCESTEWIAGKFVLRKTRSRIVVVIAMFVLAYTAVVGRMVHLTLTRAPIETAQVAGMEDQPPLTANLHRADILDREGLLLATSLKTQSLYADPAKIFDAAEAARKINKTFPDLAYNDLLQKFQSKRRFIWLKRNLTPKQIFAANQMGIPGVDFLEETRRVYPQGAAAAHVLGYTRYRPQRVGRS